MPSLSTALFLLSQCPMCKQALEGDQASTGDGLVQGFANSVYLMVATPYVLLSGLVWLIWRSARKSTQRSSEG